MPPISALFFDMSDDDDDLATDVHADQHRQLGVFERDDGERSVDDSISDRDEARDYPSDAEEKDPDGEGHEHHSESDEDIIDDGEFGDFLGDDSPSEIKGDNSSGKENAEKLIEAKPEPAFQTSAV